MRVYLSFRRSLAGLALALLAAAPSALALTAVINNAAPGSGEAPLAVAFDSTGSGPGATSFLWRFGDGAISSAPFPTHLYNTAGTYFVSLDVGDGSTTATAFIVVTVTGSGEGPLTADMNFRWAIQRAVMRLNHAAPKKDSLTLKTIFGSVDLPPSSNNLFVQFSLNGTALFTGNLNVDGNFNQKVNSLRPGVEFRLDRKAQSIEIRLTGAELHAALAASTPPIADATVTAAPPSFHAVVFGLVLGAESYDVSVGPQYVSTAGRTGTATFQLTGPKGQILDGFLVIVAASALENFEGDGHFFEFQAAIARPQGAAFTLPPLIPFPGTWRVQIGRFVDTIPADRLRISSKGRIIALQPERERGGVRRLELDPKRFLISIKTWDIKSAGETGTGLPLRLDNFTGYNITLRVDFQPDVTRSEAFDFQAVTATRLRRRNTADALWQTNR